LEFKDVWEAEDDDVDEEDDNDCGGLFKNVFVSEIVDVVNIEFVLPKFKFKYCSCWCNRTFKFKT